MARGAFTSPLFFCMEVYSARNTSAGRFGVRIGWLRTGNGEFLEGAGARGAVGG